MTTTATGYPSHLISPDEKGRDWVLQYCKAAWDSNTFETPRAVFFNNRDRYFTIKQYAQGDQSIEHLKPLVGVDEDAKEDVMVVDWSVIPIIPKFRRIALQKLRDIDFNIVATPVDTLANEDAAEYFASTEAKLLMREAAEKIDPQLLDSPALQLDPKEAKDLEELDIQRRFTWKHQMAIEAEETIELVLRQNNVPVERDQIREDLFDFGVAGWREYIDSNGAIKVRKIDPAMILVDRAKRKDFKDAQHIGEVVEMTISDLRQLAGNQFSEAEYEEIARKHCGQFGNPTSFPDNPTLYARSYDKFRIRILDLEFFSVNEMVFESRIDRRGNKVYGRASYEDRNKRKDKFERVAYKVVYKGMWIIGTNWIFNYGLDTNMKRAKSSLMDTELNFHLYAPEFYNMRAYSMMEQLIPIADAIQVAWYKLQNVINQARPKGIMIEMGALEDIPLGSGGSKLTPLKVLDLYNKTGTLVYRKADAQGRQTNYKPIEELNNGIGTDAAAFWQIIQNNIQLARDITGMNEFTDGSTPNPRALTTIAQMANDSTNNSLNHIAVAEKNLLTSLANAVIIRIQDVIDQGGDIKGYVRSLGGNTMRFFQASPKLPLYEFGIFLEEKPTDEQRARLMAQVAQMQAGGLVDLEDAIIIENTDNLKVAQQILAYRVRKRREEEEEKAMRQQQMNAQVQQQSAMVAEQAKQQTIQVEGQVKAEVETLKGQMEAELLKLKYEYELQLERMRQEGKIESKDIEVSGKKSIKKMEQGLPDDEVEEEEEVEMVIE